MYPRNYASKVPPAGIKSSEIDSVAQCFQGSDEYQGSLIQASFRRSEFGPPGQKYHVPGVNDPPPPDISFGVTSDGGNFHVSDCMKCEPTSASPVYLKYLESQEKCYESSKYRVGKGLESNNVPEELKKTGFGVSTRFGESAAAVIQGTKCSTPRDQTLRPGYQTVRSYNWGHINPLTHTFGVVGSSQPDHIHEMLHEIHSKPIVPVAVDRADHNAILQDPSPLDPTPGLFAHTQRADQIRKKVDPADLPPAGLVTKTSEFTIGDTIAEMGCMDAHDVDYQEELKQARLTYAAIPDDIVFGVPTKPNPFPNPLKGPGKYVNLGLSDEDFLKLRDRKHIVGVMEKALALSEEEANQIFDKVSKECGRDEISCAEFHQEFKRQQM